MSEIWIKNNHNRIREELLLGNNIDLISYNRPGTKRGGGISIVYKCDNYKLEENKFKREGLEIVSAVGRVAGEKRMFVIYGLYLPPSLKKERAKKAMDIINENISEMKAKFESPAIIIGGDINQFDLSLAFTNHPDISIAQSPPTRENARLDLIASNVQDSMKEAFVSSPLEGDNAQSDHKPLVCR